MISPRELEEYLDSLLDTQGYKDASYNGIQVEGVRQEIRRLATGVTASSAFLAAAGKAGVDAVLTHHGVFWRGQDPRLKGGLASRIRHLVKNDMTLLAYHLPIDGHQELGNNAVLARELSLEDFRSWGDYGGSSIGVFGSLPETKISDLVARVSDVVGREVLHLPGGPTKVKRVAIVSGGAAKMALDAARDGADVFITGEPSEPSMHLAAEERIHILAAGHHHTETFGVQAVGDLLSNELGIEVVHIDLPNPV